MTHQIVWVPRSEWHPAPDQHGGNYIGAVPQPHLVQHHTPGQEAATYPAAVAHMQAIYRSHINNGWSDIGYNAVVWDRYVFEARGLGYTGAHAPGANSISIGVAVLMDGRYRTPTEAEYAALRWLADQAQLHGYLADPFRLTGHCDWVSTSCPGPLAYAQLDEFWDKPTPTPTPEGDDVYDYQLRPGGSFAWKYGHIDYTAFNGAVAYDFPAARAGEVIHITPTTPRADVTCSVMYPSGKQSQAGSAKWGTPMKFAVVETGHVTVLVQADASGQVRVVGRSA